MLELLHARMATLNSSTSSRFAGNEAAQAIDKIMLIDNDRDREARALVCLNVCIRGQVYRPLHKSVMTQLNVISLNSLPQKMASLLFLFLTGPHSSHLNSRS